jgi:hypothetical protein
MHYVGLFSCVPYRSHCPCFKLAILSCLALTDYTWPNIVSELNLKLSIHWNFSECLGVNTTSSRFLYASVSLRTAPKIDAVFIRACNGIRTRDYDVGRVEDHTRLIPRFCCDWRSLYSSVEGNLKMRLQTLHFQRHTSLSSSGTPFHRVVVSLLLGYAVRHRRLVSQFTGLIFPRVYRSTKNQLTYTASYSGGTGTSSTPMRETKLASRSEMLSNLRCRYWGQGRFSC